MRNNIICLGGGHEQVELVKKIEAMNFRSIVVDKNLNCEAKKYSSFFINESTHSPERIICNMSNQNIRNIKAIVNRSSGYPVHTCAVLSEHLQLKNLDPKIALKVISKQGFRDELRKIDIDNIKTFTHQNEIEKQLACSGLVIKPSLGGIGKLNIKKITNIEEFDSAANEAKKISQDGNIVVEEFIDGFDYVYMGFVIDSNFMGLAFLQEHNSFNNTGRLVGNGFSFPKNIDKQMKKNCLNMANKISKNFGVINSPFNLSIRHCSKSGKIYPIELHLDLAGDFIYEQLLSNFSNFSLFENAINCSFGNGTLLEEVYGTGKVEITITDKKRRGRYIGD